MTVPTGGRPPGPYETAMSGIMGMR